MSNFLYKLNQRPRGGEVSIVRAFQRRVQKSRKGVSLRLLLRFGKSLGCKKGVRKEYERRTETQEFILL